jgi:hypothetical protein
VDGQGAQEGSVGAHELRGAGSARAVECSLARCSGSIQHPLPTSSATWSCHRNVALCSAQAAERVCAALEPTPNSLPEAAVAAHNE